MRRMDSILEFYHLQPFHRVKSISFPFSRGIDAGADVNAPNAHGRTPLELAGQFRHEEIVQLLVDAGAVE